VKNAFLLRFICCVTLMATGCVTLTPQELAYQQKFMAQPTEFEVPMAQADEVWNRALTFVEKYSDMKVESVTDSMIRTYLPNDVMNYGYTIVKLPVGDKVKFVVDCLAVNSDEISSNNAHIASFYIATGTEPLRGTLGN